MQGNYRLSILSPSMGTLEEETNSKTDRGFWSSAMRMQGPALTWCLPEAFSLVLERIWTQAGLRNLRFSGKILGIYSNLDHLRFPTSYQGNVPTLSRCLNLTNARKGLLFWLPYDVLIRECSESLNDIFCWVNTDDELNVVVGTEKPWRTWVVSLLSSGKCIGLSWVLGQFLSEPVSHF